MVSEKEIPAPVLRFIEENIDTVPQLETLLEMSEAAERGWLIADIAAHNYISEQRAEETLQALRRRGLVSVDESVPSFRFSPADDQTRALVAEVARCYRQNLSRIATLIHAKPSASIKEFARAFEMKKEK
ncbi:MAG TPA: hypothetical protein VFL16_14400 [Steroidobacteraceae bacterium]|nr:hypothetical protein [Steroidobacteraceae bacterium]